MNIEAIKDFCGEKLAEGMTQNDLSELLAGLAKKTPKEWTVGADSSWSPAKVNYYVKKWGLVEKREKPDFVDIPIKPAQTTYVMVMVPQNKVQAVLEVL